MSRSEAAAVSPLRVAYGSSALLAITAGFLGYLAPGPYSLAPALLVGLVVVGAGLRSSRRRELQAAAPVAPLVGLGLGALASPLGLVPELLAGAAALAYLVWLADDPGRPRGGVARARLTLALPALALGICWSSALLLPSSSASLGVAAALLGGSLAALAFLLSRPGLFDRELAPTTS